MKKLLGSAWVIKKLFCVPGRYTVVRFNPLFVQYGADVWDNGNRCIAVSHVYSLKGGPDIFLLLLFQNLFSNLSKPTSVSYHHCYHPPVQKALIYNWWVLSFLIWWFNKWLSLHWYHACVCMSGDRSSYILHDRFCMHAFSAPLCFFCSSIRINIFIMWSGYTLWGCIFIHTISMQRRCA